MAQDRQVEHRPEEEEIQAAQGPLIPRSELTPAVEHPSQRLKLEAAQTVFPDGLIQAGLNALQEGQAEIVIFRRLIPRNPEVDTEEIPTIYEVEFRKGQNGGDTYAIELVGEPWKDVVEIVDEGSVVRAGYKGKFRRRPYGAGPDTPPLVKEGDIIEPGGTLGLARHGKQAFIEFPLSKKDFPKGGKVKKFFIDDEETVQPDTVIAHIEKLNE